MLLTAAEDAATAAAEAVLLARLMMGCSVYGWMDGQMIKGKWMIALYCVYGGDQRQRPSQKVPEKAENGKLVVVITHRSDVLNDLRDLVHFCSCSYQVWFFSFLSRC
jgi:hypothetical protein